MAMLMKIFLLDLLVMVDLVLVASMEEEKVFEPPRYVMFMETWGRGAQNALKECQHQFRWERWNCSISHTQFFNGLLDMKANREKAFLQGMFAASIMYVVTRQCASGIFNSCSCAYLKNTPIDNWVWSGCSHNVQYGDSRTRVLLDDLISGNDIHAAMNIQNNRAGRMVVTKTVRVKCKCHGLTGACTVKSCWKEMAPMRKIGRYIKRRYKKAVRIDNINDKLQNENNVRTHRNLPLFSRNLVYLYRSPDYCKTNTTLGIWGTIGRNCSQNHKKKKVSSSKRKSCRTLCTECGYKIKTVTEQIPSSCNCKFQWCCKINCSPCLVEKTTHYCHP